MIKCECKCVVKADKVSNKESDEMVGKVILGIVGICVLAFVIIACVIIRSEAPFYGWRRYYW